MADATASATEEERAANDTPAKAADVAIADDAATLLGQGKTPHQAEIDAACELADFWRFNVHYAEQLLHEQPISVPGVWNRLD